MRLITGQKGYVYVPILTGLEGYDDAPCGSEITTDPVVSDTPLEMQYVYKQTYEIEKLEFKFFRFYK